jgi:hypothetical protein
LCDRATLSSFSLSKMVPTCFFYSLKEVHSYKMVVCGGFCHGSNPEASGGLIRWRRGLYCRGMASVLLILPLHGGAGVPLLRDCFLSFGIVTVCPVISGPVASVALRSLWFDLAWRAEASGRGMRHDPALIVGIVAWSRRSILCIRTSCAYSAVVGGIAVSSSPQACCSGGHGDLTPVIPGLSG